MNNNKSRKCRTQIEQYDNKRKNRGDKRMRCERIMKLGEQYSNKYSRNTVNYWIDC